MAARLLLALATAVTAGAAPLHDAARDGFYTDAVKMVEAGAEVDERAPGASTAALPANASQC